VGGGISVAAGAEVGVGGRASVAAGGGVGVEAGAEPVQAFKSNPARLMIKICKALCRNIKSPLKKLTMKGMKFFYSHDLHALHG
jgi:hypothetical protein